MDDRISDDPNVERRVRRRRLAEIREVLWTMILVAMLFSIVIVTIAAAKYLNDAGGRDVQLKIEREESP